MRQESKERLIYFSLLLCLGISFVFVSLSFSEITRPVWNAYYRVYLVLAILYTWITFTLLFLREKQLARSLYPAYQNENIAVIVPVYNEEPQLLKATIESIVAAQGMKDIFIIDDGSTNLATVRAVEEFKTDSRVQVIVFPKNRGKRAAMYVAITELAKEQKFLTTIDSDTILDKQALVKLIEPLKSGNIGASTGDVRLLNGDANELTKMTGAYYASALQITRKAFSALGIVDCCAGALSAYRREAIISVMDEFVNQKFFGETCTYSDDRHLTNLVLMQGYNVVFTSDAIAYTYTPTTYVGFILQQLRWKRGFFQEAIFALTFAYRKQPFLFLIIVIWELILPLLSIGMLFLVAFYAIQSPTFLLYGVLPSLFTVLFVSTLPLTVDSPKLLPRLIQYSLFNYLVMQWVGLYAFFTLKSTSWSTR